MVHCPSADSPETLELVQRWQQHRDERARDKLIRRFMPVIRAAAARWARGLKVDYEDAVQEACIGALRAFDLFDPAKSALSTYLTQWARAGVFRARVDALAVRVGPGSYNDAGKVARAARRLQSSLGRRPTVGEIAADMGFTSERVEKALGALRLPTSIASLDTPLPGSDGEEGTTLVDLLPAPESTRPDVRVNGERARAAARRAILQVAETLSPTHRTVLALRLVAGRNLQDVGDVLGISRERAWQIESALLPKLRDALRYDARVLDFLDIALRPSKRIASEPIDLKEVLAITGLNDAQLKRRAAAGLFPESVPNPNRETGRLWDRAEVEAWTAANAAIEAATLLTAHETAALAGIGREALRKRVARGAFPAPIRRGRSWLWDKAAVDAHLAASASPAPKKPAGGMDVPDAKEPSPGPSYVAASTLLVAA